MGTKEEIKKQIELLSEKKWTVCNYHSVEKLKSKLEGYEQAEKDIIEKIEEFIKTDIGYGGVQTKKFRELIKSITGRKTKAKQ